MMAMTFASMGGLARLQPNGQDSLVDRLQAEGDAIFAAPSSPWAWLAIGAIIAVAIGSWQLRHLVLRTNQLSADVKALAISTLNLITLVFSLGVAFLFLYIQTPLLAGLALGMLVLISVVAAGSNLRGGLRAFIALWRGRLRVGTWLTIHGVRGRVLEVGPFRVTIESEDGGQMFIPTADFTRATYGVASPERVFPVDIRVIDHQPLREDELALLRRIAILSPYRECNSSVTIEPGENPHTVEVRFRSWSEEGARLARMHLMAGFQRWRNAAPDESDH